MASSSSLRQSAVRAQKDNPIALAGELSNETATLRPNHGCKERAIAITICTAVTIVTVYIGHRAAPVRALLSNVESSAGTEPPPARRTGHPSLPCNVLGHGEWARINRSNAYHRPDIWNDKGVVTLDTGYAGLGNHMFMFAVAILTASERNWSVEWGVQDILRVPGLKHIAMAPAPNLIWKRLKKLHVGQPAYMSIGPDAPLYQSAYWVKRMSIPEVREKLCYYLGMRRVLSNASALAGPNDAVVYFRHYTRQSWGEVFSVWNGIARLRAPPFAYFARILKENSFSNIWVVVHPCERSHPTVRQLVEQFGAKVHSGDGGEDFQFTSSAQTLILSPSTFAWWAAYFAPYNATLHFPVMPGAVPMQNWCALMQRHSAHDHGRWVYHDWYENKRFDSSARGAEEAFRKCEEYRSHAAYDDRTERERGQPDYKYTRQAAKILGEFYPRIRGVTTTQCND